MVHGYWTACYGDIALNGGEKEFEQFSEPLGKWYHVHVYSTEKMFLSIAETSSFK